MSDYLALFIEGVLSFFSPCVLPLIPIYMGYLTQGSKSTDEEGNIVYKKSKVLLTTLFFVLGICSVFFVIALSISSLHNAFNKYASLFSLFGGVILIIFGLIALKVIEIPFLNRHHKLPFNLDLSKMNYITAYFMGFIFSFSWSPCIGPMLMSAIVKAAGAADRMTGIFYIGVYTIGFILMFLLLALFTESILDLLKRNQKIMRYTGVAAGLIIIYLGANMLVTSGKSIMTLIDHNGVVQEESSQTAKETDDSLEIEKYDFVLKDGNGKEFRLSDNKGKVVMFTFYGTWCTYCNQELPLLQNIYDTRDDMVIFLIATPNDGRETSIEGVETYLRDKGYTIPVLYDSDYSVKGMYGVSGYPTSFIYKADGSLLGYLPGYVNSDVLDEVLKKSFE